MITADASAVWFTVNRGTAVGRIELTGEGTLYHAVFAIPDGGCWVTLSATGSAVRLDASGSVVDEVAFGKGTEPHGLTVTPDGNLWVALETGAVAYAHS